MAESPGLRWTWSYFEKIDVTCDIVVYALFAIGRVFPLSSHVHRQSSRWNSTWTLYNEHC
jgi:hypothetical protein